MTNQEFENLKLELEIKMNELDDLQKKYEHETGVRFVRPLRLNRLTNEDLERLKK